MVLLYILLVLVVVAASYILFLQGRQKHPGLAALQKWSFAHRGLHDAQRPENSLSAFQAALDHGFGAELDVHLLSDGNLAVMHDSSLLRTTGKEGMIEALTTEQLGQYPLEGSQDTIPTFQQVLDLFDGKAPLIVELKTHGNNYAQLTETACNVLAEYSGPYCIESFDPRCIRWLRKNRPEMIRGQLSENFLSSTKSQPWILRFAMTFQILNFLTRPDFVAYRFSDRNHLSMRLVRKLWGIQGVSWTLRSKADYDTAVAEGWIPIFENFIP